MSKTLLVLAAFASSTAFASERIVRHFECQATYTDTQQKSGTFTAYMVDVANEALDFPGSEVFIGELSFQAPFIPNNVAALRTEERNEDVETDRDDDPEGRSGWGGTAFYGQVLKGDAENPKEALLFVTKADREQQGAARRSYRFAALKMVADETNPDADPRQEPLAEGTLVCQQR
jgi:hypothetical protein